MEIMPARTAARAVPAAQSTTTPATPAAAMAVPASSSSPNSSERRSSMALDYLETAQLMTDPEFMQRTQISCLHYATYISGEAASAPAHNTRMRWAQATFNSPASAVTQVMPMLVMDAKVQE